MRSVITLQSVKALSDGQEIYDTRLEGFRVRRQGGAITYSVAKRVHGKIKRVTIGRHGDGRHGGGSWTPDKAREHAKELLRAMDKGIDPSAKTGSSATLGEIAPLFLAHIETKRAPSTHREYKGHLDDYLVPKFGHKPLDRITTGDVRKVHQGMKDRPTLANRIMDTLSSLYGWQQGNEPDKPLHNPASRKLVERYAEKGREWRGTPDQMNRLAKVLKAYEQANRWSPFALGAIWLYLATGQRRDSIRTMKWADVDWAKNTVTMHVLRKLRAFPDDGNRYVIQGSKPDEPYKNIQDLWAAVRKDAGLDGVRIHDLRHHVGSTVGDNFHVGTVAAILGNTKAAAMRYIHEGKEATQQAAKGISDAVERLQGGRLSSRRLRVRRLVAR
jgi:integrase